MLYAHYICADRTLPHCYYDIAAPLDNVTVLLSVDEYLKLIHADVFQYSRKSKAHPHFDVITRFLAQRGSEPWTTAITASASTHTAL